MLSPKIFRFGVKAIIPYDRATYKPLGFAEVVSSGGLELSGEMVTLQGGSNRYSYDAAHGFIEPAMNVTMKEFPSWVYNLMLGATPSTVDVSENGMIRNIENRKGKSLQKDSAITGVSVLATKNADLKFGRYTVEAVTASTIAVYVNSDVDAGEGGTRLTVHNDFLKIHDDDFDLADNTDIDIPSIGVRLEVAATVSGVTAGDTFTFEVLPKANYAREVTIGRNTDLFPVFGMYAVSENIRGSSLCLIDCFKCKANGLPQAFNEKSWAESELSIMPLIDGNRGVAKITDLVRNT